MRRFGRAATAALAIFALALLARGEAHAHGLDPAFLSLSEKESGVYAVLWRASALRLPGANVQPALPARCRQVGRSEAVDGGDRIALRWTVDCGPGDLAGETIGIEDLAAAKISGLLSIERRDGEHIQSVLSPSRPSFVVPRRPDRWQVARAYAALGVGHILSGPDHLSFVLGLLLLVSSARLLLKTVTAFTLGHSLTLSVAALGWSAVPQRPVEVLIAVSVLVLAAELARDGARASLLRRSPWMMALVFGLLHGLGFAGALAEAGLPSTNVPLALFSFNVGIELGQLGFVAAALLLGAALKHRLPSVARLAARPAIYAMGTLAAFWCYERLALWLA